MLNKLLRRELVNLIISNVVRSKTKIKGYDEMVFTIESEGKRIFVKANNDTRRWFVTHWSLDGVTFFEKEHTSFQKLIQDQIGTTFVGTRKDFLNKVWESHEQKL
jgi:thymidine kinase